MLIGGSVECDNDNDDNCRKTCYLSFVVERNVSLALMLEFGRLRGMEFGRDWGGV